MEVNPVPTSVFGASSAVGASAMAQGEDFFKLISAQLQSQDPLEPVDETQFLGQLAQYAQLEESTRTNDRLATLVLLQESIAALQQMTQSTSLIGQQVEYSDPLTGDTALGSVQAVRVEDGVVVADIDGELVPLTHLQAVLGPSDED